MNNYNKLNNEIIPTYFVQGNTRLAKFTTMPIEVLCTIFQYESIANNGDHYVLRAPRDPK